MPVAAATRGGSVRVVSGSRMASRGKSGKSAISSLTFASWSLMRRPSRPRSRCRPWSGCTPAGPRRRRPAHPVGSARHQEEASCSRALPPWVNTASATLAVSITGPPPAARKSPRRPPWPLRRSAPRHRWRSPAARHRTLRPAQPAIGEACLDAVDEARAANHRVGHDQHPLGALLHELEAGRLEQVTPHVTAWADGLE